MKTKEDVLYYTGYGLAFVMAGICIVLASQSSLGLNAWSAFTLWILSMGIILVCFGSVKIKESRSMMLVGVGLILVLISSNTLAITFNLIDITASIAISVIFIGVAILSYGFMRTRG